MNAPALLALSLLAQVPAPVPKPPEVGYIHPAGGKAGTVVAVQLAGFDWTPDMQFFFSDSRVKLELLGPPGPILVPPPPYWFGSKAYIAALPMPREIPAKLTLPADLPPGPIRWQVANANGGSGVAGTFWVGDRDDVLETRKKNEPQLIAKLPVAVHGRIFKIEETDRYTFKASAAGPVTCELFARRLGANFNAMLEVRDGAGRLVADVADTEGHDLALTFSAKKDEEYTLALRDVDYRGDRSFVYRLEATAGPRVVAALPPVGKRGTTQTVEFVGYGVATGQPKLESLTKQVAFPKDDADSFLYRLETPHGVAPGFRLFLGDREDKAFKTDNELIALPHIVSGCLDREGAEHRFRLKGKKGDLWSFALEARKFDSPLDVALTILGPDGKEVARADDLPGTTDTGLEYAVTADGEYTLLVSDVAGKSGSRAAIYRLSAQHTERDFALTVVPRVGVPLGGKADLQVTVAWQSAFREAIHIRLVGLPPGVSAPASITIPPGVAALNIPLECAANAAVFASRVQVVGSAKHIGQRHVAKPTFPGNLAPRALSDNQLDTVLVSAVMKPRAKVATVVADGGIKVNRGTTYPAELTVERLEGFTGEISLQMAAVQSYQVQGITGPDFPVPPGATKALYPCFMPEWLETTRTSRMICIAVCKVPDPKGNVRYLVADVYGRITMSIEGSLLKLTAQANEMTVQPGKEFSIPVRLGRAAKLTEPVKLELIMPDDLQGLLKMEPVTLQKDSLEATLKIVADAKLAGEHVLTLRATAIQAGNLRVVSEVEIPIAVSK